MGNCCGGEAEQNNIDVNKPKKGGKGAGAIEGANLSESGNILEHCNEKVRSIHG